MVSNLTTLINVDQIMVDHVFRVTWGHVRSHDLMMNIYSQIYIRGDLI